MCSLVNNCFFYSHADNHPVHHAQEVVDHIYDSGVIIRFLPPYSTDLNPIEEVFAKVKHYSRQNDVQCVSCNQCEFLARLIAVIRLI